MPNGHNNLLKFGQNRGSGDAEQDDMMFCEEQLFEAKQALFTATTVREIKFLQNKIGYLQIQIQDMQKKERKAKKGRNLSKRKPKVVRFRPRAML